MLAATVKSFELLHKIYTNVTLLNCLNAHLDLFILTDIACRDCLLVEPLKCREALWHPSSGLGRRRGGVRGNLNIARTL